MSSPALTFADLGLPAPMVDALARDLITSPFAIQAATIPDAMDGHDVLGRAPTGSGKTLAFGLPVLAQMSKAKPRRPTGLIMSPTRELAEQIRRELHPAADAMGLNVAAVYGGTGFGPQLNQLRQGVDLLVACPGRLLDLISQGEVRLDSVEHVVVDEADRMADMGFLPEIRKIIDQTTSRRQTVLFSATLDDDVQVLTDLYLDQPVRHEVGEVEPDLSLVTHRFVAVEATERTSAAAAFLQQHESSMVFVRTRHGADRLARQLKRLGVKAGQIHGGRTQAQRDAALRAFTNGKISVLVATDVAARGIHVDGVQCVLHYDPPADHKDYVHRSGRTARAGAGGLVITLVVPAVKKKVVVLRKRLNLGADDFETELPPLQELPPIRSENTGGGGSGKARPGRAGGGGRSAGGRSGGGRRSAGGGRSGGGGGRSEDGDRPSRPSRPSRAGRTSRPASDGSPSRSEGSATSSQPDRSKSADRSPDKGGEGGKPKRKPSKTKGPSNRNLKRTGKPRPKNKKTGAAKSPSAGAGASAGRRRSPGRNKRPS